MAAEEGGGRLPERALLAGVVHRKLVRARALQLAGARLVRARGGRPPCASSASLRALCARSPLSLLRALSATTGISGKIDDQLKISQADVEVAATMAAETMASTGKAGDMSIHHARLIHGSAMNTSTQPRRVLFFEYAAVDAWPLAGVESVGDLTEFNSRIVHGEPTLQPRLEDVPVRLPLPRAVYQGSIYENQRETGARYFDQYEDASLAAD